MNGLLYKNIMQNKYIILVSAFLPTAITMFYVLVMTSGSIGVDISEFVIGSGIVLRIALMLMGYLLSGMIQEMVVTCDESKKWAYFTATTPTGTDGQMYIKYVIIFMICGLTYIVSYISDLIICAMVESSVPDKKEQIVAIVILFHIMFFVQIFARAISIPFLVRFSSEKSSYVRMAALLVLFLGGMIYLLFGKLPDNMTDFAEKVYEIIEKIMRGEMTDTVTLLMGLFPFISVGLYILSYKISCKLYMKGVETYAK